MDLLHDLAANPELEAFIPSTCLAGDMTTSHTGAQLYLLLGSPGTPLWREPYACCSGRQVGQGSAALVSRGAWGLCSRPSHQQGQAEEALPVLFCQRSPFLCILNQITWIWL